MNVMIFQFIKNSIEEELEDIRVSGNSIEVKESEKYNNIFHITCSYSGIVIEIDCYSDLLKPIVYSLINILFKSNLTSRKADLISKLVNNYFLYLPLKRGYQNAFDYFKIMIKRQMADHFKIVYPIGDLTQEMFSIIEILKDMSITCLFYGNIDRETIDNIYNNQLIPNINSSSTALEQKLKVFSEKQVMEFLHEHKSFNGSIIVRFKKVFPSNNDYITSNYYQIGVFNDELDIITSLITILWEKQFMTKLRKAIKNAHYVYNNIILYDNILYFTFVVQGNIDPKVTNIIMDKIIGHIFNKMKEITEDDLYYAKENLISFRMQKDTGLSERAEKVFREIYFSSFNFNHSEVNRKNLKAITKEKVINEFNRIFIKEVKKISIQRYVNGTIPLDDEDYFLNQSIHCVIITNESNIIP